MNNSKKKKKEERATPSHGRLAELHHTRKT